MATCDFEVSIEIHDGVTATILGDLNDQDLGLSVGVPLDDDDDRLERITASSPFVHGDFDVLTKSAAGRLEMVLLVTGSTWSELVTTYRTAREWWRQSGTFHLDVTIEGDTQRYLARRPDVTAAPLETGNLVSLDRYYVLSFPVQPNPVVI
jgi:hypothetical protein